MINVEITEGVNQYYYETTEKVLICYECKRTYKKKKYCNYCKKETKPHTKIRTGIITKDLKKYSCSCIFSSWFRFGKHWKDNHPESNCKHFKWALKEIEGKCKGCPFEIGCDKRICKVKK